MKTMTHVLESTVGAGRRQFENRTAGVPIRVRRDSPLAERRTRTPTLISARRTTHPSERGIGRRAPEVRFSPRPADPPSRNALRRDLAEAWRRRGRRRTDVPLAH